MGNVISMRWSCAAAFVAALAGVAGSALAQEAVPRVPSPKGAKVYFISPADGETVRNPVLVRFGLSGMGVAPAGVQTPSTGHHHLLVDIDLPKDLSLPLPTDDHHRHFGGGQTELPLALSPGKHTLQLVLGDYLHRPHDPPVVSERITITVE
jgi:hypothetical protein